MANNKTSNIYIRIEPEVKKQAEEILSALGIGASQAVNMFYKQIILHQGMPFDVVVPNEDIIKEKKKIIKTIKVSKENINEEKQNIKNETDLAKERENQAIAEIKKKYGL